MSAGRISTAPVMTQGPGPRLSQLQQVRVFKSLFSQVVSPNSQSAFHLGTVGNEHYPSLRKGVKSEVENPLK